MRNSCAATVEPAYFPLFFKVAEETYVLKVDLDIDSDNGGSISDADDTIEDDPAKPGKFVDVNSGDKDNDGVPNFADGIDLWGNAGSNAGGQFTPLVLELPEPIDLSKAKVRFMYSESDPEGVARSGSGTTADPYTYVASSGHLRIWNADGSTDRITAEVDMGGNFVKSGTEYSPSDLGFGRTIALYVEGISNSASLGDQRIVVEVDPDGPGAAGFIASDAVRCTVVKLDLDIDSDNNNGFGAPGQGIAEDQREDITGDATKPGKFIGVNNGDNDKDTVPNFADGIDLWGNAGSNAGGQFTQMILELPEPVDLSKAKLRFTYSESDPERVARSGSGTTADPYIYAAASGHLRIWNVDGSADRITAEVNMGGNFVKSGTEYSPSDIESGRRITLYLEGIGSSASIADQRIVVEVDPDGPGPAGFISSDAVRCTIIRIELNEMSFSGTDNHTLQSDDQATIFSVPHYLDSNLDGDANDAGERSYPVCYTRNKKMKVAAKFKMVPTLSGVTVKVKADGPGNADIPEAVASLASDTITLAETEADNAFADEIDLRERMKIRWSVSFDDGGTWDHAGHSTNTLYVTWDAPKQPMPIQTLVHVGCDAAAGVFGTVGTDDGDVLDSVWYSFQTRSIHRASDGLLLTYYGFYDANGNGSWDAGTDTDRNDPGICTVTDAEGLISSANGQCNSWAEFMNEVLKAQGLSSINGVDSWRVAVVPRAGSVGFAVQNWAKTGSSPRVIILGGLDAGVDGLSPTAPNVANDEAADVAGAAGQGNSPNPPAAFGNHFITKMNGAYYDPSYGLGPFSDLKAYEDAAFAGSIDRVGADLFLEDLPSDNANAADHSDEINIYAELAFP